MLLPDIVDFSSKTHKIFTALSDLGRLVKGAANLLDRKKAKRAARHLAALAFMPDGMQRPLERIAAGVGTPDDFSAISDLLDETDKKIKTAMTSLSKDSHLVRENHGMDQFMKLNRLLHGYAGKSVIREDLTLMIEYFRDDDLLDDRDFVADTARDLLRDIKNFNNRLIKIHDTILPPSKSP